MTLFRILALPAFCFPVLVGFSYVRRFVVAKWLPQLKASHQRSRQENRGSRTWRLRGLGYLLLLSGKQQVFLEDSAAFHWPELCRTVTSKD